jgi:hypothetical protein
VEIREIDFTHDFPTPRRSKPRPRRRRDDRGRFRGRGRDPRSRPSTGMGGRSKAGGKKSAGHKGRMRREGAPEKSGGRTRLAGARRVAIEVGLGLSIMGRMASCGFRNNSPDLNRRRLPSLGVSDPIFPRYPVIFGRIPSIDPSRSLARFRRPAGPDNPHGSINLSSRAQALPISR